LTIDRTLLVDAEEIAGARTGVPRATYFDLFPLSGLFNRIVLLVGQENYTKLIDSEEYRHLKALKEVTFEIIQHRPTNRHLWVGQLAGGAVKTSSFACNVNYNSLFPLMFKFENQVTQILRLHDPFGSSRSGMRELVGKGKRKLAIARALRTSAFGKALRRNVVLVANSYSTKEKFIEIYGLVSHDVDVVWPSVGFRSQRSKFAIDVNNRKYLLSVMGQRQRKNPLFVINTWASIADEIDIDFINIGFIPHEGLSVKATELMNDGRLSLIPKVSAEELKSLQSAAYASIFCSTGEGFGLPVAESIFFGVPVIHNSLSVLQEISGGILPTFDIDDPEFLIEILKKVNLDNSYYEKVKQLTWQLGDNFTHESSMERWRLILERE
jgi:glycosyltransferase involved in cell wall biosynthesis